MIVIHLSFVIEMMAGAVQGCTYDVDVPWPLHYALVSLAEDPSGALSGSGVEIPLGAVDDAGWGVPALAGVMVDLRRAGAFQMDPARPRRLVQSEESRVVGRRGLFRLSPELAVRVQRAARLWATDALTLSKNFDTAAWSSPPTFWVRPSNPRQFVVPGAR